ncbi:MAG: tRNA (adenosine(37)-N6)-threonylcarbamoyltransferase complex ATPase subunit type 1 TsaE [Deltaproteobacteria bacterium]|nr:tRNA (adenosine(37)-N6)-threonylcarbamoyltransferase complex ATPase subunit type 1 TsaE [Deltaproteobacteria bacterium]
MVAQADACAKSPQISVETHSEEETEALGRSLGAALGTGAVVAVSGPLGAGKTVLARGLACGLGIDPRDVVSPSFVYLVEYDEGRLPFVHADLYRLGNLPDREAESVYESIGLNAAIASGAVVFVEWWEHYAGPPPAAVVRVELVPGTGNTRTINLEFSGVGLEAARLAVALRRA